MLVTDAQPFQTGDLLVRQYADGRSTSWSIEAIKLPEGTVVLRHVFGPAELGPLVQSQATTELHLDTIRYLLTQQGYCIVKAKTTMATIKQGSGSWDAVPTQPTPGLGPSLSKSTHTITHVTPESPSHYVVGGRQAWDVMKELVPADAYEGYLTLNVVKYLVRHRKKNGKEDLLKARKYLDKLIETCYEAAKQEVGNGN